MPQAALFLPAKECNREPEAPEDETGGDVMDRAASQGHSGRATARLSIRSTLDDLHSSFAILR